MALIKTNEEKREIPPLCQNHHPPYCAGLPFAKNYVILRHQMEFVLFEPLSL